MLSTSALADSHFLPPLTTTQMGWGTVDYP
jgi:hypothetical protein